MSIAILLQQIVIIFLEIGTGFGAAKLGILDDKNSKFLSNMVMFVMLPCTLLASANVDGGSETVVKMVEGFALLEALYLVTTVVCLILSKQRIIRFSFVSSIYHHSKLNLLNPSAVSSSRACCTIAFTGAVGNSSGCSGFAYWSWQNESLLLQVTLWVTRHLVMSSE